MNVNHERYISTLTFDRLTPLYDPLVRWILRENAFNWRLLEQGRVEKGQRVLDVGCRTATLAMLIKKARPGAEVIGIDGDRNAIAIAKENVRKAGLDIPLFDAGILDLPCRDGYFDRIFTGMLFHHLATKDKILAAAEMHRVLKPGGELHVADFGRPQNALMAFIARMTRNFEEMDDNIQGLLPHVVCAAGFEHIETTAELTTMFGTIALLRARKPV